MNITPTAIRYHRNGCFGAGFYVVWFTWTGEQQDYGRRTHQLQAVVFDAAEHVAVTSANLRETWRGDDFESGLRAYIASDEAQRLAFAA